MRLICLLLLALECSLSAQDIIPGGASAKPWRFGASLPATCNTGDGFFLTAGSIGLYACTAVNIWTLETTQGSSPAFTSLSIKGPNPWADVTQYGLLGDGVTDNTPLFNTMMTTLCASNQAHTVYFPISAAGNYVFNSAPNGVGCETQFKCANSPVQWNPTGVDSAQLTANYNEVTPGNPFIGFTGSTSPGNSGIEGCLLWKGAGKTGGTAIKYSGTGSSQRAGGGPIQDVRISGDGTWAWGVRVDCSNITAAGAQGCRDISIRNLDIFQTTVGAMFLSDAVHLKWIHGGAFPTGGNAHVDVTGVSGAGANSVNVDFADVEILDTLALDWVTNFVCAACYVNNLTATVNTVQSFFDGVSNVAPTVNGQLAYDTFDGGSPSGYGTNLFNSGHFTNFVSAGAVPSNVATGDVTASNSTTSGNFKLGSDGLMIIRRNNGVGAGTNLALTFDGFSTTPLQFENTNGLILTKPVTTTLAKISEGTCSGNVAGVAVLCGNSVVHDVDVSTNNSAFTGLPQIICANVTPVTTNTSTTADQNLQACTIPAGTLNRVGRFLEVYTAGVYSTAASSTAQMTLKAKLCTVSGCGSGTVVAVCNIQTIALATVTVANNTWAGECTGITQTAGASAVFERSGRFTIDLGSLTSAADSIFLDPNATAVTAAIDSSAQLFLQITDAFSAASGSNSYTGRTLIVKASN